MRDNLLLIDGSSMLVTAFYGNVPADYYKTGDTTGLLQTSDGRFTNAVFTMTKTILKLIKEQNFTHMAVCWDLNRSDLKRKKMFADYKANRSETKPELGSQFGLMQDVLKEMGIPQFVQEGDEADDIIGTFANRFEEEIPVYIMTKDQDALQLLTERTRVWMVTSKAKKMYEERQIDHKKIGIPQSVFEYTPMLFKEEYQLQPLQLIDKKGLEGESSDNIPGVKGVGPTAVLPLLQEFGTIESIYAYIEETDEQEVKQFFKNYLGIKQSPIKKLRDQKESAYLSKTLATIDTQIEEFMTYELSELLFHFNKQKAIQAFQDLEMDSLIKTVNKQ